MTTPTLALTHADMDKLVDEHLAYESKRDLEGVLATLTTDAFHDLIGDPVGPLRGRTAIGGRYEQYYANLGPGQTTTNYRLYGDGFVVSDETWTGPVPGEFLGIPGHGRPITFRMLHVFEFRDGLIERESLWIDSGAVVGQLSAGTTDISQDGDNRNDH